MVGFSQRIAGKHDVVRFSWSSVVPAVIPAKKFDSRGTIFYGQVVTQYKTIPVGEETER